MSRGSGLVVALVALAGVVAVAIWEDARHDVPPAGPRGVSGPAPVTPGTIVASTNDAALRVPGCRADQLYSGEHWAARGPAGSTGGVLLFVNAGRPCTLKGAPVLRMVDGAGVPLWQARPTPAGPLGGLAAGQAEPTVRLGTGQAASALYEGLTEPPAQGWFDRLTRWINPRTCPELSTFVAAPPGTGEPTRMDSVGPLELTSYPRSGLCDPQVHPVVPGGGGGAIDPFNPYPPELPLDTWIGRLTLDMPEPAYPPCASRQLVLRAEEASAGMGQIDQLLMITNRGPSCSMFGYPEMSAVDAQGRPVQIPIRHTLPGTADRGGRPRSGLIPTVDLPTGDSASLQLDGYGFDPTTNTVCPPRTLRFAPPGADPATSITTPAWTRFCTLSLTPIAPGTVG